MYDYHVHSTYSDGSFLEWMVSSAEAAGLEGIGIADHCSVVPEPGARRRKRLLGFNLDVTYERRREAIDAAREGAGIRVLDAVEMDYHPDHEDAIGTFLEEAGFDYAIGSVHDLEGVNVHTRSYFADRTEAARRDLVDRYFEKLVALIDAELFAIAAHPDLIERNPHLRGFATSEHYERVAAAFDRSRTVPEINAGRLLDEYGEFHPAPAFLDALADRGVGVTVGTDSHDPEEIEPRAAGIREELDGRGLEPVEIDVR
ncbi:PHP domain-containing protein [Halorubrum halodurans]|uniref:histidinol-phosphatase n=1 Tax=Halorubrum halodurans TaxID=1383851 RepID=A0A256IAI4_9EURY|nr:PHP domain-containing protein [Halorubrum halodurans]OYR53558.1 histidinol-phosphatase [Halorubrum halodurans]